MKGRMSVAVALGTALLLLLVDAATRQIIVVCIA